MRRKCCTVIACPSHEERISNENSQKLPFPSITCLSHGLVSINHPIKRGDDKEKYLRRPNNTSYKSYHQQTDTTRRLYMMTTLLHIITILNICSIYHVSARSGGAPTVDNPAVCSNLNPSAGHPASTAAMPSPYSVNVDKDYFMPGEEVTVSITGNANFNGILLQGREKGTDKVVGSFSGLSSKLRKAPCPDLEDNQTVTHSEHINLNTINVKWSPPTDVSSLGNVSFLATVVQSRSVYWVKLESRQLSNDAVKPTPSVNDTTKMSSLHVSTTKKTTTTACCRGHAFISNVFVTVVCVMFVAGQLL